MSDDWQSVKRRTQRLREQAGVGADGTARDPAAREKLGRELADFTRRVSTGRHSDAEPRSPKRGRR